VIASAKSSIQYPRRGWPVSSIEYHFKNKDWYRLKYKKTIRILKILWSLCVKHIEYMERALRLAQKGRGYTSPNPMVGAVIVKNGRIIGEGYHPQFGQKHAEVMAIENALEPVAGAEMYCTLEPCTHTIPGKKTPPCAQRLIDEKIRKVYISTLDPNPYVNGIGVHALREAGIEVETGYLAEQAAKLNEAYVKYIQLELPFVHLKIAMSLDGRIATASGDSKWITDEAARQRVHQLRHQYDAVLVGANTVRIDNPHLTVRLIAGHQPLRVILSRSLNIPPRSHILKDAFRDKTIIFTAAGHDAEKRKLIEHLGVRVIEVIEKDRGRIDLAEVLMRLGKMGISSLLVEGGSGVFTEFISRQLFDKVSFFVAPMLLGEGIAAIGDLGISKISRALRLQQTAVEIINDQILIRGYRNIQETFGCLTEGISCLPESSKSWAGLL
jgi:diaminohydroxyphosphoribosylaminopyrimidine deaminase/5-amino-6-(5-phosphoribosylamino)uracil reductase